MELEKQGIVGLGGAGKTRYWWARWSWKNKVLLDKVELEKQGIVGLGGAGKTRYCWARWSLKNTVFAHINSKTFL